MQDIWTYLQNTAKPVLIYGMGDGCDKIMAVCREKDIRISGIFASDDYAREKTVHGFPLMKKSEALSHFSDPIVLLAFGVFREDLMGVIKSLDKQVELYAPEVPLFGGGLFDASYENAHRKELDKVREMLSDEASRKVFDALVTYKLTGRIAPLLETESDKQRDFESLIPYQAGDIYLDLGAYDGDTVREWDTLHPDRGAIYGVEPNPKTFAKLVANCGDMENVTLLPYAAWNRNETLTFNGKSGRSAALDRDGSVKVEARRPDSLCQKADFIKFDVEGAEREAILGSTELIRSALPTLCISAYHRTEDLFAIPLLVKEIAPEYRVYLRHSPYIPAWDTQFYFVGR